MAADHALRYAVSACENDERVAVVELEGAERAAVARRMAGGAACLSSSSSSSSIGSPAAVQAAVSEGLGKSREADLLRQVTELRLENAALRRQLADGVARDHRARHGNSPAPVDYMLLYSARANDASAVREALTLRQLSLWTELRLTTAMLHNLAPDPEAPPSPAPASSPSPRRTASASPSKLVLTRRQLLLAESRRLKDLSQLVAELT
ncbi:hypothetical protein DIPPA_22819 [Diplonema papillatum]|nr:hypothetical protein DIPPA_11989 [Diplonema papillatum]KAJ9441805.1 hypothetical protein DIPPA_22819 [Diplonema papillatum]